MKTYRFNAVNWVIFLLVSFISLVGGLILIASLAKGNTFYFIFLFVILIFFIIYILRLTSFAKVEIVLDNETVSIKWLERFLFYKKRNIIIPFDKIATYVDEHDVYWEWLKIKMSNGKTYKIWHSKFSSKNNDYFNFVSAFVSSVRNHNDTTLKKLAKECSVVKPKSIRRAKSIYEGTGGTIMAVFAIVIIIVISVLLFLIPHEDSLNYFSIGIVYLGAIYFLYQFYVQRKKRSTRCKYPKIHTD